MFQSAIAQEIHLKEIRSGFYAQAPSAAVFDKDLIFAIQVCSSPDFTTVMLYALQSTEHQMFTGVFPTSLHSLTCRFVLVPCRYQCLHHLEFLQSKPHRNINFVCKGKVCSVGWILPGARPKFYLADPTYQTRSAGVGSKVSRLYHLWTDTR